MQYTALNNGVQIPMQGYGVFQLTDKKQCESCVSYALEAGYRLFDTAAAYGNENEVGLAIKQSRVPREELFITTKVWVQDSGYDNTMKAFDVSLKNLKLDYIDLYLIHQPFGDYYGTWKAMEQLYKEGLIRAVGVSNFTPERIVDLCMNTEIRPAVNQIEIHPFFQQREALRVMRDYGVMPQAWGPLSEGQKDIFHHRILEKIAGKYHKSTAQIILRWHMQRGIITIPKTTQVVHMKENLDIFDFSLSEHDMEQISLMDIGHSEIMDTHCFCTARQLNSLKIHE